MPGRPYSGNHTHAGPSPTEPEATTTTNMVVVGILIGLIITLSIILVILLVRPVMDYLRSSLPENHRRKELRYQTVEGWVISKVRWPCVRICDGMGLRVVFDRRPQG